MSFLIIIILSLIILFLFVKLKNKVEIDNETKKKNEEIKKENQKLEIEQGQIKKAIEEIQISMEEWTHHAEQFYATYADVLDNKYKEYEQEYDENVKTLQDAYNRSQDETLQKIEQNKQELNKISATRAAAQEAILKEKEIQENLDFYCLSIADNDLDDIQTLERIKPKLHQPRILCMLIWSTYFQKPMTSLCNNVLGLNTVCGIYKITNQETTQCYIGQAVDVAKRWKDHAKCGLGIDTPTNNKLYAAMAEYGLQNFSFELLEACKKEDLNEKEKMYIEMYQSKEYGYNSITAPKKN